MIVKQTRACGWFVLLLSCCVCAAQSKPAEFPAGVVIPKVVTLSDAQQSYALFLPSNYTPSRAWPIVYVFDPGARGRVPTELMKEAAEKYGYIIAASNNSKNGPVAGELEAAKAVWSDTHQRFSIDEKRIYASGFSGGARLATIIALQCGCIAGVFANGAGFPEAKMPTAPPSFIYFASIGDIDFNHAELIQLGHELDRLGVINRIREFSGPHQWAPADVVMEAFQWFDLQAMRKGLRPADAAFITERFNAAVQSAKAVEVSGDAYTAYGQYQKIVQDFKELRDVNSFAKSAEELKNTKTWKAGQKQEQEEISDQDRITQKIVPLLDSLQNSPAERDTILATLREQLSDVKRRVEKPRNASEGKVNKRALSQLTAQVFETGQAQIRKGQYAQAVVNFDLAAELLPQSPRPYYQEAMAYSLAGDKKKAIRALKEAVKRGFKEETALREAPEFAKIRDDEEFKAILASISATSSDVK